jgi:hypothetical protein
MPDPIGEPPVVADRLIHIDLFGDARFHLKGLAG